MHIDFSSHNIRLDNGTRTKPDAKFKLESHPWFISAKRIIETVFPGDKKNVSLADLGCLEGGYAVEFARMGLDVLGVEVRESNIAACNYVKSETDLPNLRFVKDNALNIANHGSFDVVFCCGLFYHLNKPKEFLEILSSVTSKLVILQTHFSTAENDQDGFNLSGLTENEGLPGRWYREFEDDATYEKREKLKWASWDNNRSFWIQREWLLKAIQDAGFDLVMEQFDSLEGNIAKSMLDGFYKNKCRGTFIGIKTGCSI